LREEDGVGGHRTHRMSRPGDARIEGAEIRFETLGPDNRADVVPGVSRLEGADNGELVSDPRQLFERITEDDSRDRSLRAAGDGANAGRRLHLGVEGLELAGASLLEEENHRLAPD